MKTVTVNTSKTYSVIIGSGLLCSIGHKLAPLVRGRRVLIVSDSNVWPIYGKTVQDSLECVGFSVFVQVIKAGEASKNAATYLQLLAAMAENQLTRGDCILALGGGVVGDLAGFAASTYLRGISLIQVPTTLLSMVDSSVGGKNGINLSAGKNLAGTFYQPDLVLCDTDTLATLPDAVFTEGCAEVIKYGILFDPSLFSQLEQQGTQFHQQEVIGKCIAWKADIVGRDEFDIGQRQLLNLGHTIGHSIEKASDYSISHGYAVAIGICASARGAAARGLCSTEDCQRIIHLMQQFSLPTSCSLPISSLVQYACSDKKRDTDFLSLILPATIGCCRHYSLPINQLEHFIKEGL